MSDRIRIGLLVLFLVTLTISGWQLSTILLWEYWSLLFLLSFWAIIILLVSMRKRRDPLAQKYLLLSTFSGVLLTLSFPPFPFPLLIFLALVPLLYIWYELKSVGDPSAMRKFAWYTYNGFVVWNLLTTFWVCNSALFPGMVAIWLNSFFMLLPFLFAAWSIQRLSRRWHILAWIIPWVAFEYGHLNWEISWPWLTLGNSFANFPAFVQWFSVTGVLGGTVWVLMMNYLLSQMFFRWDKNKSLQKELQIPAAILLLPIAISLVQYFSFSEKGLEKVNFSIIQPNYEPHYEKFHIAQSIQLREIIDLMSEAVEDSTDYVLLPETVFDNMELSDFDNQTPIRRINDWLNEHENTVLIMGLESYRFIDSSEKGRYTRRFVSRGDTSYYQVQNSAVVYDGNQHQEYFKSRFVPGAEIFPYSKYLFFIKPLVDVLGGSATGFEPQKEPSVFSLGKAEVAPLICYESIYPEYATGFVRRGGRVLAIMTNDGWWGDTFGYRQHNAFARLLAIELGRDVVRSANTGISSVINARGNVLHATKYGERTYINAKVPLRDKLTIYARTGDIVGKAGGILLLLLLIANISTYFRRAKA